jgi:hypothetical protein
MLLVFNVTFNNISVLLLEETGVPLTILKTCPFLVIDERCYAIEHSFNARNMYLFFWSLGNWCITFSKICKTNTHFVRMFVFDCLSQFETCLHTKSLNQNLHFLIWYPFQYILSWVGSNVWRMYLHPPIKSMFLAAEVLCSIDNSVERCSIA